ncbi:MAG: translation initiation factor IF-2, partial [SAR324 cluster bacterium]|nr:translation initiation factor IF-2 [SAR324 cluster bacterium]
AKELGVDNKVVIDKAREIGVSGKISHSNSLDADEAETIRRAVLRQTLGVAHDTEVVTKRVNKITGETATVVERRKGDVIRRRKQSQEVVAVEVSEALDSAETESEVEEAEQVDVSSTQESIGEIQQVEDSVGEPLEGATLSEVAEERPTEETEPVEKDLTKPKKKTVGPKVLGRIELPVKKASKPEAKKHMPVIGFGARVVSEKDIDETEEEEGGKSRGRGRKGRKREISRFDLLDYEGRENRRVGKGSKAKADKRDTEKETEEAAKKQVTKKPIKLGESIMVGDLAKQMNLKAGEVIAKLMELGVMVTINHLIDKDTAIIVAEEMGYQHESTEFDEASVIGDTTEEDASNLQPRPPVVTVMGHVDHGKTTLLDYIRKTSVAAREAGGITQHIGAYSVNVKGKSIAFIDTPGHAAFTAMRARGAEVTDIVILVVAADDGVMPQTIEAINHAKAAKVPIVVAVNKIDKPNVNVDRIRQQLAEHGLQPEDWGGDTMFFPVSALTGQGVEELLEGVLLLAEVKELKANPETRARGTVIEARQERGKGTVATVLVQAGTLRVGDIFVAGSEHGRVRSMSDHANVKIVEAGPSTPVEITGFEGIPAAGDDFLVLDSEAQVRQIVQNRQSKKLLAEHALATGPISLEEFSRRAGSTPSAELNIILKVNVHGSLDAVRTAVEKLSTEKAKGRVVHAAVGGVTESDVQLAIATKAIVIGFNIRPEPRAMSDAEQAGVEIRFYRIIYELVDDVKKAMVGLLEPIKEEKNLGLVEVRDVFTIPKAGTIAGSYVLNGLVKRGSFLRLLRDNRVIHEGRLSSLRRFKDDVKEVQSGYECGIGIENFNDIKPGDQLEIFEYREIAPTLD